MPSDQRPDRTAAPTAARQRYRWRTWGRVRASPWINLIFVGERHPLPSDRFPLWRDLPRRELLNAAYRLFAKGPRDCGRHEWYNADGDIERCYHCTVGEQPIRSEWRGAWDRDLAAARGLYASDAEFRADVDEELTALEGNRDDLMIMLWHDARRGRFSPRRARRHLREAG